MSDEIERIAEGLSEALEKHQRQAIRDDGRSGFLSFLATLLVIYGLAAFISYEASFWVAVGAFAACVLFFYESGKNSQIEKAAAKDFIRAHLQEQSK